MNRVALIFSGGMDSTVLLYHLLAQDKQVTTISFDYGQKHRKEIDAAQAISSKLGITNELIDLRGIFSSAQKSALVNSQIDIPDARYACDNMSVTVVPNRNMIFLSVAASIAINFDIYELAYGAHSGDHFIYADCRPEFVTAIGAALSLCHSTPLTLNAPFINYTKAEICSRGSELEVPFGLTWSCYKGQDLHCGHCGTCIERREAFISARISDPTCYEDLQAKL